MPENPAPDLPKTMEETNQYVPASTTHHWIALAVVTIFSIPSFYGWIIVIRSFWQWGTR